AAGNFVISSPLSQTLPLDGFSTPVKRLTSVLLPAPLGPISACRAPASIRRSRLLVTRSAPKFLQSPWVSSTGSVMPPSTVERPAPEDAATGRPGRHLRTAPP